MKNLDYISSMDPNKVIIRVPVLPGFNFDNHTMKEIFKIAIDRNIRKLHLLPYHTLGKNKYEQLGIKYNFPHDKRILLKDKMKSLQKIGEQFGLSVQI